ncbi:hypothetical protein OG601_24080 [Streptomyces sp. NBC_01239]|uniref:hypothetical protein n=1 Tax=Streptomyces sp. NBC_01239 TaxID=2903792 RepID=UPI00225127D8|nr:hypothetical protein [Streptomyces sp. NBC_01239]MCX4813681.1 hypothetical protein [Streptomyces sp. NBC_01239]
MKLPEIAILVSSASAAITGGNVILTYRTFRRVRPKVKVKIHRSIFDLRNDHEDYGAFQHILRFRNEGQSPVSVERIELLAYRSKSRFGEYRVVRYASFERGATQEPLVVPALDGTTYKFAVDVLKREGVFKHQRFRVVLTNGQTVLSKVVGRRWSMEIDEDDVDAIT